MNKKQRKIGWILVIVSMASILAIGGVLFSRQIHSWSRSESVYQAPSTPGWPDAKPFMTPAASGITITTTGVIYMIGSLALSGLLFGAWLFILAGQKES